MPSTAKLRPFALPPEQELPSPNTPSASSATAASMLQMANKTGKANQGNQGRNAQKTAYPKDELWIAPSFSFQRKLKQSDWKLNRTEGMEANRFLEMADIALGLKSPEPRKKTAKRISN